MCPAAASASQLTTRFASRPGTISPGRRRPHPSISAHCGRPARDRVAGRLRAPPERVPQVGKRATRDVSGIPGPAAGPKPLSLARWWRLKCSRMNSSSRVDRRTGRVAVAVELRTGRPNPPLASFGGERPIHSAETRSSSADAVTRCTRSNSDARPRTRSSSRQRVVTCDGTCASKAGSRSTATHSCGPGSRGRRKRTRSTPCRSRGSRIPRRTLRRELRRRAPGPASPDRAAASAP